MFRKEIKVTDCTLRDGGLINKWQFSHEMVRKVFLAVNQSGADYMELGYRASKKMFDPKEYGPWRFTTDQDVCKIIKDTPVNVKLGVMVEIGSVEEDNTIEAIRKDANYLDATVSGIGRGAGDCPLELLLSFLKNPKYDIEPILQVLEDVFLDLRKEIEWGYLIPYMITGVLNQHPRSAIALRQDPENRDKYAEFYRKMTTPECLSED